MGCRVLEAGPASVYAAIRHSALSLQARTVASPGITRPLASVL